MGMFIVTEQRLVDQKNNILKRKWLSDLELEEKQKTQRMLELLKCGWKAMKMRDGSWDLIMKDRCVYERM